MLEEARAGEERSWQRIQEADDELGGLGKSTKSTISKAETILLERLQVDVATRELLQPAYREYQEVLRELYQIENGVKDMLQIAQFIIESWDKSQRALAKGQPSYFTEVTMSLLRLAFKKAAN